MNLHVDYQPHRVIGKNKIEIARCLCFTNIGLATMRVSLNLKETDFFSSLDPSKDSSLLGPAGEGVDV